VSADIDLTVRALVANLDAPPDPADRRELSPILCVMWTILALDRRKPGFIEQRIKSLQDPDPEYGTLASIREMARLSSPRAFFVTEMRDSEGKRAPLLLLLLDCLIDELRDLPGSSEAAKARSWATAARPSDWSFGPFRGLGLKGFQHLRQLLGAHTVIPTREIIAFVSRAVGRTIDATEAVYLLERAAGRLGYDLAGIPREVWARGVVGPPTDLTRRG